MNIAYEFKPEDFRDVLGLSEELSNFYRTFEEYTINKSQRNRFSFEKQGRNLFFTIKHRELEGGLTRNTAAELREYMEELLYD